MGLFHCRHRDRSWQQTAIGRNLVKDAIVRKSDHIEPRIGTVEQPQTNLARWDICYKRRDGTIDDDSIPKPTVFIRIKEGIDEPPLRIEGSILNDDWQIIHTVPIWQVQCVVLVIINDDHASQAAVDLVPGFPMGV